MVSILWLLLHLSTSTLQSQVEDSIREESINYNVQKPNESSIRFYKKYWQEIGNHSNVTFRVWKAYYDDRPMIGKPTIRIVATTNRFPAPTVECYLWNKNDSNPVEVVGAVIEPVLGPSHVSDHALEPVSVSCPIQGPTIPDSISLSIDRYGQVSNLLNVVNKRREVKDMFAVCVIWLKYDSDYSIRMVEWIEMVRILGANHIFINILHIHPNMSKVLDHYVSTGFVSVTNWTLPGSDLEEKYSTLKHTGWNIERTNEVLPLQDCLMKSMSSYQYLVKFDLDEMLIPIIHNDWNELIESIEMNESDHIDSFSAIRAYFLDDDTPSDDLLIQHVPENLHMMRHIYKGPNILRKEVINLDRCVSILSNEKF